MNHTLERLKPLILELKRLPDWPVTKLPAGLLLYDVLVALGASATALDEILGKETLILVGDPAVQDAK